MIGFPKGPGRAVWEREKGMGRGLGRRCVRGQYIHCSPPSLNVRVYKLQRGGGGHMSLAMPHRSIAPCGGSMQMAGILVWGQCTLHPTSKNTPIPQSISYQCLGSILAVETWEKFPVLKA